MQEIDVIIDEQTQYAKEFVLLKIRNQQAHDELQSFNDIKQFKYIHELTTTYHYKTTHRDQLKKLKEENPESFLNEITNLSQNIRRIESDINTQKYKDEGQHQSWLKNLERAKTKRQLIIELL